MKNIENTTYIDTDIYHLHTNFHAQISGGVFITFLRTTLFGGLGSYIHTQSGRLVQEYCHREKRKRKRMRQNRSTKNAVDQQHRSVDCWWFGRRKRLQL